MVDSIQAYQGSGGYFFVSYAHKDAELVEPEISWINDAGYNLWFDDGIHVGTVWRKALADALSNARGVIFMCTANSSASANCLKEINFALNRKLPVFVIRLDQFPLPPEVELAIDDIQSLMPEKLGEQKYRHSLLAALSIAIGSETNAPAEQIATQRAQAVPIQSSRRLGFTVGIALTALALGVYLVIPDGSIAWDDDVESEILDAPVTTDSATESGQQKPTHQITLAVIPFQTAEDQELSILSQAILDDLVFSMGFFGDHRTVVGKPEDYNLDTIELGEKRKADYILSGTLAKSGDRTRLSARLTNSTTSEEVFVKRYDIRGADLLSVQDQVADIGMELIQVMTRIEIRRAGAMKREDMDARHLELVAGSLFPHPESAKGVALRRAAIEMDPNYALAHGTLAFQLYWLALVGAIPETDEFKTEVVSLADRALQLSPNDQSVLAHASYVHRAYGNVAKALALATRRYQLPGTDHTTYYEALIMDGRAEEVITLALAESNGPVKSRIAQAYTVLGDFPAAEIWYRQHLAESAYQTTSRIMFSNVLAQQNKMQEAMEVVAEIRERTPGYDLAQWERAITTYWRGNSAVIEPQVAGLRKIIVELARRGN